MPATRLAHFTLLPELRLVAVLKKSEGVMLIRAEKASGFEVCPRCASKTDSVYDRRSVTVSDAPLRNKLVRLEIKKRRFYCRPCGKVFMEPISGITKRKRFTQRFKAHVLWACENFTDLKSVKKHVGCSYGFLYSALYEQLELQRRKHHCPWPKIIGMDEHSFKKNKHFGYMEFATMFVDHRNRKTIEVAQGKSAPDLKHATSHIPGKENVSWVTMDLCEAFRRFTKSEFPRASIVADKFHVVRLLDPHINRHRKMITGDVRKNPIRKLLLKNSHKLEFYKRRAIFQWLEHHPHLKEIYGYKQALHKLYRTKGYNRALRALNQLIIAMGYSTLQEVKTLRRTLMKWKEEILNYFRTGLTNARVEGFNNKAKLIKRRAYGYRSFKNYRLRLLNACR